MKEIENLLKEISFLRFKQMYPTLKKIGIHPGQEFFLKCIVEQNGLSQRELAEMTKRKSSTITKALQRLENSEYIKREQDKQDRRIFHIHITEKGRELYQQVQQLKSKQSRIFEKCLTKEEKQQFYQILCKIKNELEEGGINHEKDI